MWGTESGPPPDELVDEVGCVSAAPGLSRFRSLYPTVLQPPMARSRCVTDATSVADGLHA